MGAANRSGCVVCGRPLVYAESSKERSCHYCRAAGATSVACTEGHYVCDICHSASANELIERTCRESQATEPMALAMTLMRDRRMKMHGPEHHYLVPAVLLTAYANATARPPETRAKWLSKARARAEEVKGGSCGFNGACGAGIGTGIFVSVASAATPLSGPEWRLANLMTSEALRDIALNGGPRCCKRDTFLALARAKEFIGEHLGVSLPVEAPPVCEFSAMNRECLGQACPFFAGA